MNKQKAPMVSRNPETYGVCWCICCTGGSKKKTANLSRKRDRREGKKEIQKQLKESNGE